MIVVMSGVIVVRSGVIVVRSGVIVVRSVLFDLGPTFMFVSDKCTDVYLPYSFKFPNQHN